MAQIKTRRTTWSSIVGAAAFREGVEDYQAGRAPDYDRPKGRWQYERGRQYAAACAGAGRAPQPNRRGRSVSRIAIHDFAQQYGPNGIL
jgi:hypothetical protein